MLKRLSARERLDLLLAEHWPLIKAAFMLAIEDIKSKVILRLLVERLERGDLGGAIDALQLEAEAFSPLDVAIADAYNAGGMGMAEDLRLRDPEGRQVAFRFGVRNPAAEQWLREHSSMLVTRIVEDQREAIRNVLADGMAEGQNPRATALNIVGRVNRVSGKREGGIIGLTSAQERAVAAARAELVSGDATQLRAFLTRQRRDRRFDRTIAAAIRTGKPLPADVVSRVTGRYADRLLDLRGEMLARTESMIALGRGRDDAMRQAIESGKVSRSFVTKTWRSAADGRVRHTHRVLNGQTVPFDGVFQSPSGAQLRHPGDPAAPVSEVSGCRCVCEYKISHTEQWLARNRS